MRGVKVTSPWTGRVSGVWSLSSPSRWTALTARFTVVNFTADPFPYASSSAGISGCPTRDSWRTDSSVYSGPLSAWKSDESLSIQ